MLAFMGANGMNAYMYAPKDDALHRAQWRVPYGTEAIEEFRELVDAGQAAGVRVGFAISPGLDISYADATDRDALRGKCVAMLDCGIDWFLLALDDIPMADGLADDHADLANWLFAQLTAAQPSATLMVCPTEYLGVQAGAYTRDLAVHLNTDIALMWTGPTVCSPTVSTADASVWRSAFPNHDLIVWDNYPVNDGAMATRLHAGPYGGRSADLDAAVQGILLNPMNQAISSRVALGTAAAYLNHPHSYEPIATWHAAMDALGSDDVSRAAANALCRACADGPTLDPDALPLARIVRDLQAAYASPNFAAMLDVAADELSAARSAADTLLDATHVTNATDDPGRRTFASFANEVQPWAERLRAESRTGLAAINVIRLATQTPVEPLSLMGATFALTFHWTEARRSEHVVFGPRFATYPAIVMHASSAPVFDAALGVIEDRNAIDALCRFAMRLNNQAIAA